VHGDSIACRHAPDFAIDAAFGTHALIIAMYDHLTTVGMLLMLDVEVVLMDWRVA